MEAIGHEAEASSRKKRSSSKSTLRLPDLEHAKSALLNGLNSADAKRGYRHAIEEFVDWYCSEPRLAFNRIVVLRYRSHLESQTVATMVNPDFADGSSERCAVRRRFC
jgi:hypothetical protein